jgi:hypothetical protein
MVACPFNIPAYEYDKALHPRVRKCTLCFASRLKEGRRPACVEACPREVMTFGKRSELIDLAHSKIAAHPDKYVNHVYGETEVGGTSYMYLASAPFEEIGFREDLGVTPYPELTRSYLSAAPLILALWPVFFTGLFMFSKRRDTLSQEDHKPADKKVKHEEGQR